MTFVPCFVFWFFVTGGMVAAHPQEFAYLVAGWATWKLWRWG